MKNQHFHCASGVCFWRILPHEIHKLVFQKLIIPWEKKATAGFIAYIIVEQSPFFWKGRVHFESKLKSVSKELCLENSFKYERLHCFIDDSYFQLLFIFTYITKHCFITGFDDIRHKHSIIMSLCKTNYPANKPHTGQEEVVSVYSDISCLLVFGPSFPITLSLKNQIWLVGIIQASTFSLMCLMARVGK